MILGLILLCAGILCLAVQCVRQMMYIRHCEAHIRELTQPKTKPAKVKKQPKPQVAPTAPVAKKGKK